MSWKSQEEYWKLKNSAQKWFEAEIDEGRLGVCPKRETMVSRTIVGAHKYPTKS